MNDQTREYISDITSDKVSDCCGEPIINEDICSNCKEHCGEEDE